jgi:hypothetical protein
MADNARSVLSDPRAPQGEQFDARAELEAARMPTGSDLIPAAAFDPILEAIRSGSMTEGLAKASRGAVVPFPASGLGRKGGGTGMRGLRLDPGAALMQGQDYVEKPGMIDFGGLKAMVEGTPILAAVIGTRIKQMMRFASPSEDGGPGFEIRHIDKEHKVTKAEKEQMKVLQRFITNGGMEFVPRKRKAMKRDTFPTFLSKQIRDSLIMDAAPFETEMRRDGRGIDGFYHVAGESIRLCAEDGYQGDDEIFALQIASGKVGALYSMSQLTYEVRNPRSDLNLAGYGLGETELLVRTVTALLNAISYNADYFDKNSIPKGLLQIFGDYGKEDTAAFRRHWQSMVSGAENRHALPVLVGKDKETGAVYTPLDTSADEMAFAKWMTFLTSVICAVYAIDPSEIGFESFAAAKSTLSGSDTTEKMASSRDKGFRPLASFFEATYSDFMIADFNPDFCLRFAGMEEEDKDRAWEAKKLVCTVDEIRAEEGMKPHPDPKIGALPVNPTMIGPAMMMSNPQPGEGDFGAEAPMEGEQPEDGDDFGAEAAPPQAAEPDKPEGTDFGSEAAAPAKPAPAEKPGNDFGKALSASALWRLGTFR